MAIDQRVRTSPGEWIAAGLLVVATAGGGYLIGPAGITGDLDFIEVGWWNIRDLNTTNRDDAELADIADAIAHTGIDVLAVGELNNPEALERIAEKLGSSWQSAATAEKIGRTPGSREYYGFLWDGDRADMVGSVQVDPDPEDKIDRHPAWATFRTTGGGLDFTLVGVHITWGSTVAPRKAEIRALPAVWGRAQSATTGDEDVILVGDFNRNVGDDSFDLLLAMDGMIRANEDTGPTVVTGSSTYDQVFISTDFTQEWTGEYDTYAFDVEVFNNDDAAAKLAVSDHRPVWITLYVTEQDDD